MDTDYNSMDTEYNFMDTDYNSMNTGLWLYKITSGTVN